MLLETLATASNRAGRLTEMKDIFFLSAAEPNRSSDEETRERFWRRWTSYYIDHSPSEVFFAIENKRAVGYLTGCRDSRAAGSALAASIKSYALFEDLFDLYPAHLHMNVHPSARGKGVGAALIEHYIDQLQVSRTRGVHIVTAPGERNVDFYLRHEFQAIEERAFNDQPLLFMGRDLIT